MLELMNEFAEYVNGTWGREAGIKVHCSTGQVRNMDRQGQARQDVEINGASPSPPRPWVGVRGFPGPRDG